MKTVWKIAFEPGKVAANHVLPEGATPLHVAMQFGEPAVWFEIDTDRPAEAIGLVIVGTGHVVPDGVRHVGTCMTDDGAFVWHIYQYIPASALRDPLADDEDPYQNRSYGA